MSGFSPQADELKNHLKNDLIFNKVLSVHLKLQMFSHRFSLYSS